MRTELIGNRKKGRLEELAREAENDPVFVDVMAELKGDKCEFSFLKLKKCDKAMKLINGVEKHIGFIEKDGAKYVCDSLKHKYWIIATNLDLVIAYNAIGKTAEARELMSYLEPKTKTESFLDYTSNIATAALAHLSFGRIDEAANWVNYIFKNRSFQADHDWKIVHNRSKPSFIKMKSVDSALLALACAGVGRKNDTLKLINGIKREFRLSHIVDDDTLLVEDHVVDNSYRSTPYHSTSANAYFAMACYNLGQKELAKEVMNGIDMIIEKKFNENEILIGDELDKWNHRHAYSSLAAALAYMAQAHYENEN